MTGATGPGTDARIVVKIGSALLVDDEGAIRHQWLADLARDFADRHAHGGEIMIVSSGAIAVGRRLLNLQRGPRNRALRLEESQAAAATGQIRLAHAWQDALGAHNITVAQILLTLDDTENRRRYLNARGTLATLLKLRVVPVINENDTIATDEIRFGDNDRLAARVAQMTGADTCIILSDVDGLYSADPATNSDARHIAEVTAITPEIEAMAGATSSADGSGGMVTKLAAARIAVGAGCRLIIADGRTGSPLQAISSGARCTTFLPAANPRTARKHWIAGSLNPAGEIAVDAGALRALHQGRSLLPAGVVSVSGAFERGDLVLVQAPDGTTVGRGLSAYSAADAALILGHKSSEIERLLGYRGREEMIHRDDLVLR